MSERTVDVWPTNHDGTQHDASGKRRADERTCGEADGQARGRRRETTLGRHHGGKRSRCVWNGRGSKTRATWSVAKDVEADV